MQETERERESLKEILRVVHGSAMGFEWDFGLKEVETEGSGPEAFSFAESRVP